MAAGLVEAGDEHVADPVEQRRDRQQQTVGARRVAARRDVCGNEEPQHDGEERPMLAGIDEVRPSDANV